jgi:hypothetical protein
MKFIIATGFTANENKKHKVDFFDLWMKNTLSGTITADMIYIINGASTLNREGPVIINMKENLGHVHHLITKEKNNKLCGWTMSTLIGAMCAYHCCADMIYKEQDCLCFGNWLEDIYEQAKDAKMLFGKNDLIQIEQSLIYVRYDALLDYVNNILSMPESDAEVLPEKKFKRLIDSGFAKYLPFGYGRNRPINLKDKSFYVQQLTTQELEDLRKEGFW